VYSKRNRIINQWRWGEFESGVAHVWRETPEKFFVVPLHFFGSIGTVRPSCIDKRFRDGQ